MTDTLSRVIPGLARGLTSAARESPVAADLCALACGDYRATALDGRYGSMLGDLARMVADGDLNPSDTGALIRALDRQRSRWGRAAKIRLGGSTRATEYPSPVTIRIKVRNRGVPSSAIGNPDVVTFGRAGYAPDQYAQARLHDRISRAIAREHKAAKLRSDRAPRTLARDVSGMYSGSGGYHATPGKRPRKRKR